jgi:hypothetical protein
MNHFENAKQQKSIYGRRTRPKLEIEAARGLGAVDISWLESA